MQFDMKRALYLPEAKGMAARLWTMTQRMLTPYVDIVVRPAAQAGEDDVILTPAEAPEDYFYAWGEALTRCAALDDQPELAELAEVLAEATQVALDNTESVDGFFEAVGACLSQLYNSDVVILADEAGEVRYEVLYRALRGEEEYAVLMPAEEDDGLLILRCVYPVDGDEPGFADADEDTAQDVYAEFMEVFADELSGED